MGGEVTRNDLRRRLRRAERLNRLGAFALVRGVLSHGMMIPAAIGGLGLGVMAGALALPHDGTEAVYTVIGVLILALGHDLNRRAVS